MCKTSFNLRGDSFEKKNDTNEGVDGNVLRGYIIDSQTLDLRARNLSWIIEEIWR